MRMVNEAGLFENGTVPPSIPEEVNELFAAIGMPTSPSGKGHIWCV